MKNQIKEMEVKSLEIKTSGRFIKQTKYLLGGDILIIDELIEVALNKSKDQKILDVRIGLGYTGVQLDDDSCGVAYTFKDELGLCCTLFKEAGKIIGKDVKEVIKWSKDRNLAKVAMGVASINAIINSQVENYDLKNIIELIDAGKDESFGMVGNFRPIMKEVRKMTENIYIFEKKESDGPNIYKESDIDKYLPKCEVVLITSTSIINGTIDDILEKTKNARSVYLVGPTTTLCPEVLKKYGIDILAGTIVNNPKKLLDIISQGGGTRSMKETVKQVVIDTSK